MMFLRRAVMGCGILLVSGWVASSCRSPESAAPSEAWRLVLRHVRVADPSSPLAGRRVTIGIRHSRIDAVLEEDAGGDIDSSPAWDELPSGTVLDLEGQWVLPGYIDTHVHFLDSASLFTSPDDFDLRRVVPHAEERERIEAAIPLTMRRYLCSGVTTAVGLGGPSWEVPTRDRLAGDPEAARMLTTGPFFANFPVGEFTLWTEEDPVLRQLRSVEEAKLAVGQIASEGVDLAKIGIAPLPEFSAESFQPILEAFVAAAHERGLRVAAHAEQLDVAKLAIRAGVDILAHTVVDRPIDSEFIDLALDRDIIITSGLSSFSSYAAVLGESIALSDIESRCGDPYAIASWTRLGSLPATERPPVPAGVDWGSGAEATAILLQNTKRAMEAGIVVAVGTNGGQIGTLHGPGFHRELAFLARAGVSNELIIEAATVNGGLVVSRQPDRGRVLESYLADLVILDGDPRRDIERLSSLTYVVRGGTIFDRDELDSLVRD